MIAEQWLAVAALGDPSGRRRQPRYDAACRSAGRRSGSPRLADELLDAHGGTALLLGTETDADAVRAVRGAMRHPSVDLTGALDFGAWQALAQQAALYIGNDTGMTHCALAGGAPTLAIFGPTDPRQYGLYGGRGMMAVGHVPWSPCFRRGRLACTCGTIRCMERVTVAAVRAAAEQLIGATRLNLPILAPAGG